MFGKGDDSDDEEEVEILQKEEEEEEEKEEEEVLEVKEEKMEETGGKKEGQEFYRGGGGARDSITSHTCFFRGCNQRRTGTRKPSRSLFRTRNIFPQNLPSPSKTPGMNLPSFRKVGKLVQTLPGVSFVTHFPGASAVARLPVVSSVIDALFVDAEESTSRALSTAAITPRHVLAAAQTPSPPLAITPVGIVPAPKGSVVYFRENPAQPPPRIAVPETVKSITNWGIVKTLGMANSSVTTVNAVGDFASSFAERLKPSDKTSPSLYRARDAAFAATSSLLSYVTPLITSHLPHRSSLTSPLPLTVPSLTATFRHFCAFPP
ncbi:hypothetical protein BC829DRAFT_378790, partial [Chytridium lagenaria]